MKNRVAATRTAFAFFFLLFPWALTGLTAAGAPRQSPSEEAGDGKITYINGECYLKPEDGAYRPASVDQAVFASDTVKTGAKSEAEITLSDGSTIVVTGDSELTVSQPALGESRYTSIGLIVGRVKLMVGKLQRGGEFTVNTLTVTAGVRGTSFGASVREDGAVLVDVEEGLVEAEYAGTRGEAGARREIAAGEATAFSLAGEREDYRAKVDAGTWREKALQRIRENAGPVVAALLERERGIIEALKKQQGEADDYRREWAEFARKVRYLESKGLCEQEKALIAAALEKTRRGLLFLVRARRNLTAIRSTLVLAARIEQSVGPQRAKELPSIEDYEEGIRENLFRDQPAAGRRGKSSEGSSLS
jgi:hypothetical protein